MVHVFLRYHNNLDKILLHDLISSITKSASLGENANVILCINFLKSAFPNESSISWAAENLGKISCGIS